MKSKNLKNKKNKGKAKDAPILKRKQLRKEKRQAKKKTKKEFVTNKYKKSIIQHHQNPDVEVKQSEIIEDEEITSSEDEEEKEKVQKVKKQKPQKEKLPNNYQNVQEEKKLEMNRTEKQLKELKRQQKKQRKLQLKIANEDEEKNIKFLEKQLGMKRRKSKNLPKAFADDGLDFLLDAVDPEKLKNLSDVSDSDEDFPSKKFKIDPEDDSDNSEDGDDFENEDLDDMDGSDENEEEEDGSAMESDPESADDDLDDNEDEISETNPKSEKPDRWEDIYGRLRDKDGNVLNEKTETKSENVENPPIATKYIPPALRKAMAGGDEEKKRIALLRLNKQVKGMLNRLAESNMHGIASQMEELYRDNSRNDMNQTITDLLTSSLIMDSVTPERLVMEHVMLAAILHANVGTEVGAHVLQVFVKQFDSEYNTNDLVNVDNKKLDNIALVIAYIYNFKIVDAKLIFDLLDKLVQSFKPKDIEIILLVLKNVGFVIRKDDPAALKDLILKIQSKASSAQSDSDLDDSRVKFMLEILMAIKNNNVNKIPNYDPSHFEHLKKTLKTFVREGNYVTEMKVGLDDLLKADQRGRWWIVGSAFTGFLPGEKNNDSQVKTTESKEKFSGKLLELARKMRMNTDVRKNIFCIVMSAEDYLDAFEKLAKLGTKNQNEREVIFVLVDCCVQEKNFNPYYPKLISKLATFDRKYRLAAQFTIWDKLKQIDDLKTVQVKNLGQLTCFLIKEKSQPLSVLKVIQFSEMNKRNVAYLREVLLGILLQKNVEQLVEAFQAVSESPKLNLFREGLRLFMQHFLIKQSSKLSESVDKELMKKRIRLSETALLTAGSNLKL